MLTGFDEKGVLRNVKMSEKGEIYVKEIGSDSGSDDQDSSSGNINSEVVTTLYAGVITVGTEEISVGVSQKVKLISVANYSETANITINVDEKYYTLGPNMIVDLPINKTIGTVGFSSNEANTKVQYVIKGIVESESDSSEYNALLNLSNTTRFSVTSCLERIDNIDTQNITSFESAFLGCTGLTQIPTLDTRNATDMSSMFSSCLNISNLNLSNFVTNNVENMASMFAYCTSLENVNLTSFDTSNVTDMQYMFNGCSNLSEINISNFNTTNVENMAGMFMDCMNLTELDLSNFDTSSVTNMSYMFCQSGLETLDIRNFDVSNVESYDGMFSNVNTECRIIANSATATWLNEHFPEMTNVEIV